MEEAEVGPEVDLEAVVALEAAVVVVDLDPDPEAILDLDPDPKTIVNHRVPNLDLDPRIEDPSPDHDPRIEDPNLDPDPKMIVPNLDLDPDLKIGDPGRDPMTTENLVPDPGIDPGPKKEDRVDHALKKEDQVVPDLEKEEVTLDLVRPEDPTDVRDLVVDRRETLATIHPNELKDLPETKMRMKEMEINPDQIPEIEIHLPTIVVKITVMNP